MLQELQAVQRNIRQKEHKLRSASDIYVGMEIMHQFAIDLLGKGTPAAQIFETTLSEEYDFFLFITTHFIRFKYSWVVTKTFKVLAWFLLVLINLFFVYFCLLRAMTRDLSWQRSYMVACVVQLIIEILIFESLECMWIHFAIPNIVADEVEEAISHIHDTIDEAFSLNSDPARISESILDAPSYFFVSTNLAEIFPQPFESGVVSAYRSVYPSPGGYIHNFRQSKSPSHMANLRESKTWGLLKRLGFIAFLTSIIQLIGTFPIRVQKLLIHVVQPILLAFLFIAWIRIASSLLFTILACMALIFFGMLFVRWLLSKRHSHQGSIDQNTRRACMQRTQYSRTISLRKMTSTEANHPSTTIEQDEEEKIIEPDKVPEPHRTTEKVTQISSKHIPPTCFEKSDEEKADLDSESFRVSSCGSQKSIVSSMSYSAEQFADPFDEFSSFDEDPVQDAYDISESSDSDEFHLYSQDSSSQHS